MSWKPVSYTHLDVYKRQQVSGAGRLVGLDNGDSTDYDSFKGISRRLSVSYTHLSHISKASLITKKPSSSPSSIKAFAGTLCAVRRAFTPIFFKSCKR